MRQTYMILLVAGLFLGACHSKKPSTLAAEPEPVTDVYLGQEKPGIVPKPFAAGMNYDNGWELAGEFGPDRREFHFVSKSSTPAAPVVVAFRKEGRGWKQYNFYATFSNDGNRLYKGNKYIERTADGWSALKSVGPMFEREDWGIMRLTESTKGTYIFDDYKSNDVIRISRLIDGERQEPELLGPEINTGTWTAHPMIAPDESYLIWDSEREGGYGDSDLYVSFRQTDGNWGKAINLGDQINTEVQENSSWVSPDGKYLFFWRAEEKTREDGTTYWKGQRYWVSMEVIENLRPSK